MYRLSLSTTPRRSLRSRWASARLTYRTWLLSDLGAVFSARRAVRDFFST